MQERFNMSRTKRAHREAIFHNRVKRLRRMMRVEGLDALLITKLANVRYLAGFTGSSGCLLAQPHRTAFISDNRYREQAAREVVSDEIHILTGDDLTARIVAFVKELKLKRLGIESKDLSLWQYLSLEEVLDRGCRLVPVEDWVESLRQIKDEQELGLLKKAAHISDRAFRKTLGCIREGMSELELSRLLRNALEEFGGSKNSFDPIVLFGGRASLIHGQPGNTRLKKGQLILMDFGTVYRGYCSDMTRTVALGEPGDEVRSACRAVRRAQREARQAVKSGKRLDQIDAVARGRLEQLGYGEEFIHATGHGLGLEIHEDPKVSEQCSEPLRPDMIITIEPGVYRAGKYGVRIEDMVRVTRDGSETLTRSPRQLIIL